MLSRAGASKALINSVDSVLPRIRDVLQYWRTILRSGVIGVFIGILPGVGEDMAAWSSYAAAKRASKEKEKFGKGSIEGPDGRRDRRQRVDPGRHHPGAGAGHPGLGARRPC